MPDESELRALRAASGPEHLDWCGWAECGDPAHLSDSPAALQAEIERLRSLLLEVLGTFTEKGTLGRDCLRTPWHYVETVENWRRAARTDTGGQE